ncbi:MAG TPA: glycosyltransferase [Anaerolineaceae bacterium]
MSSPLKVLIFSGARGDTRRYRTFHLAQQARLAGLDCTLTHYASPSLPARLDEAQVAILHRVDADDYILRLVHRFKQAGGVLIGDTDDYVFDEQAIQWIDSPDFADPIRTRLYRQDLQRRRRLLEACDAVLASTPYLKEQVEKLNLPAFLHRNAFSLEMLSASEQAQQHKKPAGEQVVFGYASGTPTHNRDFALIAPVLKGILARCPQAALHVIGYLDLDSSWSVFGNRVVQQPAVPWRDLPPILAGFDVNLAPLVSDNPFGLSKSEIKFVEAALVLTPTVASRTPAFESAIQDGQTGWLAESPEEWDARLESLLAAPTRRRLAERAYQDVLLKYHPLVRANQLLVTLKEILLHAGRASLVEPLNQALAARSYPSHEELHTSRFWIDPALETHPNRFEQGMYTLLHRSPAELPQRIWVFFRRLAVPWFPFHPHPKG